METRKGASREKRKRKGIPESYRDLKRNNFSYTSLTTRPTPLCFLLKIP
jgi:hypothetical protein